MSFGEKRPKRDQTGPLTAKGSQELCAEKPAVIGPFQVRPEPERYVRIGVNGGGLETQIQRSPFSAYVLLRLLILLSVKA